jgi:hypothetical protein
MEIKDYDFGVKVKGITLSLSSLKLTLHPPY